MEQIGNRHVQVLLIENTQSPAGEALQQHLKGIATSGFAEISIVPDQEYQGRGLSGTVLCSYTTKRMENITRYIMSAMATTGFQIIKVSGIFSMSNFWH